MDKTNKKTGQSSLYWFHHNKNKGLVFSILISLLFYLGAKAVLNEEQASFVGVTALIIGLWTTEGLPLGVVSLLPLVLYPMTDTGQLKEIAPRYADPVIFLFLGGFFLAIAVEKTGLHKVISHRLLEFFPPSPRGLVYSVFLSSALLSAILSNTTVTLMLYPTALILSDNHTLRTRLLLATAYGATVGGVLTPIGTPPNLYFLGFLENKGKVVPSFTGWIIQLLPVVIIMTLTVPGFLARGLKDDHIKMVPKETLKKLNKREKITFEQKKAAGVLIVMFALLLLNSKVEPWYHGLGLNEKLILLGFGLLVFFPPLNILHWNDTKKVPFEILFLFGAGLVIADGFIRTGIAGILVGSLGDISSVAPVILLFALTLGVSFMTEVTSNTAFISISIPIIYKLAQVQDLPPSTMLAVTIATSYAFMLPIATPPNAIVIAGGELSAREMARHGFFVNLIGVIVLTTVASLFW